MADKLIMWTLVLLTILALGLFVFLVSWTREHRSAPPRRYNTAIIMASTFALVGFVFLGFVLGFVEQGVLPACLFSDLSCSVPSDSETGAFSAITILLGFALPVAMLKPGLKKKCPVCKRFGALELLTKAELFASEGEEWVPDPRDGTHSRKAMVLRRTYDCIYVCIICNSRTHKFEHKVEVRTK